MQARYATEYLVGQFTRSMSQASKEVKPMQQEKKSYVAPELTVYGNIEEITQYVSGSSTDYYGGSAPG